MRAVIQRVRYASVTVNGVQKSRIEGGLLIFLGVEEADTPEDIAWMAGKVARLRIFNDEAGVMNRSVCDVGGSALVVSQFTLFASTKKGNRPSYIRAAPPAIAVPMYDKFVRALELEIGKPVGTGEFGADMKVDLCNDGPVTIVVDSKAKE